MTGPGAREPVVVLRIAGETYGVPVASVREVLRDRPLEPAPAGAEPVAGVAVVGEERLAVLDLNRRLGGPGTGPGARLVVVRHPRAGPLALRVDATADVRDIDPDAVEPVPDYYAGRARGVRGLVRLEQTTMILLDVPDLLSAGEAEAIRRVAEAATDHTNAGRP